MQDWEKNTEYSFGYDEDNPVIKVLLVILCNMFCITSIYVHEEYVLVAVVLGDCKKL